MVTFTATDGTTFTSREEYRSYEMETQYTFRNKNGESLRKLPGSTQGQPFDIADCDNCTLEVLDNTDMVQIDAVTNSKVFIAGSGESVFVRNCENTTFTLACKQLRTRDCVNCKFYLYSKTEPIIETSTQMSFAPFNGAFKGHSLVMSSANLQPNHNLWFAVFDFNDEAKTGKNWRLMEQNEEDPIWCPLGKFANCCPRIAPGSIALPSQGADPTDPSNNKNVASSGGMMSFGLNTSMHEAAKTTGDAYLAQETERVKHTSPKDKGKKGKKASPKNKAGVGWNPDAFAEPSLEKEKKPQKTAVGWNPDAFAEPEPEPVKKPQKKTAVGWNPDAFAEPTPEPAVKKASPKKKSGVGWNAAAVDEPTPTKAKSPPKKGISIGWNASALDDDDDVPIRCDNPTEIKRRISQDQTTGRSRTDSDVTAATQGERGVTLELQAVLMFAVERGIDLVKWFTPDDEKEAKLALTTVKGKPDLLLVKDIFSAKLTGLGLGLGAGQDEETQELIAAAISRGSIDTCSRKRNCDSGSAHPKSKADRISLRTLFEVAKVDSTLTTPAVVAPVATPGSVSSGVTAMAARRGVSSPPKKRDPPPPVSPARIKAAPTPPLAQKPLWSPSAPHNNKNKEAFEIAIETPQLDLEREIETCLKALCRQADTYFKLRSKLGLDDKGDEEIKMVEVTKALSGLGLKLGPAGQHAMFRRVCGTGSEDDTPAGVPASMLRDYFLNLKLSKNIKRSEWEAEKKQQEALEQAKRQKEFQKGLAGLFFSLEEEHFDSMIESFEIVTGDVMKREVHARGLDWLSGNEGVRISRRKAMAAEVAKGEGVCDDDDRAEIMHKAKTEVLKEKKAELAEEEKASQSTSKWLFRMYVQQNKRKGFQDCVKFSEWCRKREDNRDAIKDARKEWVSEKDAQSKQRAEAGSKVAAVADVEEMIKDLVSAATVESKMTGGVGVVKPSRKGLELAKKLRDLERLSGGKVVSKSTFDEVMHNLIFSLLADKKTSKQARTLVTEFLNSGASAGTSFFVEDGSGVADRVKSLDDQKRSEAQATYDSWCKKKKALKKKEKKDQKKLLKKKKLEKKEKAQKSENAFTEWLALHQKKQYFSLKRKEQVPVPRRSRKGTEEVKPWIAVELDAEGNVRGDASTVMGGVGGENVDSSNL
ncbi:hypothetical protein TrLO_g12538 [Triparma laevis f. longispina]|uniref:C-CAP/cofactor C-like domain-containing protein n=1 Tax=Triparma laevis f. longispina TaxID=1714387 RepID=A0A9W7ACJ2_9STRA|nr:hypothetical protein TrLO_g12538 [Triparma laevis f. longispina]